MMPFVTAVMPTYNRTKYLPTAVRCFFQQAYPNKELIIVDDGDKESEKLVERFIRTARIRHYRPDIRTSTGNKRNMGAEFAFGEIIIAWDDDDFSGPHRIEDQVQRLIKTGKAVTGYNATVLYDEASGELYKNLGGPPYYASGTSQCYWKTWWEKHPFPDASYGEDSAFARVARLADELSIADPGQMMVARKHASNTAPYPVTNLKKLDNWKDIPADFLGALIIPGSVEAYMEEKHSCCAECLAEARAQFESEIIDRDYHVTSLPEVQIR